MAKGQDLTRHQRGIVNRYYEHRDTIMAQKVSEIVSDLYLAESEKKAASLWERARKALGNTGMKPEIIAKIVDQRDLESLARAANELAGKR